MSLPFGADGDLTHFSLCDQLSHLQFRIRLAACTACHPEFDLMCSVWDCCTRPTSDLISKMPMSRLR